VTRGEPPGIEGMGTDALHHVLGQFSEKTLSSATLIRAGIGEPLAQQLHIAVHAGGPGKQEELLQEDDDRHVPKNSLDQHESGPKTDGEQYEQHERDDPLGVSGPELEERRPET